MVAHVPLGHRAVVLVHDLDDEEVLVHDHAVLARRLAGDVAHVGGGVGVGGTHAERGLGGVQRPGVGGVAADADRRGGDVQPTVRLRLGQHRQHRADREQLIGVGGVEGGDDGFDRLVDRDDPGAAFLPPVEEQARPRRRVARERAPTQVIRSGGGIPASARKRMLLAPKEANSSMLHGKTAGSPVEPPVVKIR